MKDPPINPSETRDRLLDAAEVLFAEHGFETVSLRRITREADVNLAAVNYHFGSKEALIGEVLARIIEPINAERLRLLDAATTEAGDEPLAVETILDALFRPVVTELKTPERRSAVSLKLAGRCLSVEVESFSDTFVEIFREVVERFVAATVRSLPGLDETDVFWRLHLSVGTLIYALTHEERLATFSGGRARASDPEDTLRRLVEFTAGGLRAEAGAPPEKTPRKGSGRSRSGAGAAISAFAGLFVLTGCQSLSPPDATDHASVPIPAHWIAGPSNQPPHHPDRHWVKRFDASDLTAFVDSAVAHNRDLKVAQARIGIALENARITGADLYPQLEGGFSAQRSLQNFIGFPFGGAPAGSVFSTRSNRFGLSLDLTWEVDLWGRIRAATASAVAEFEASTFDRATAELSLSGQAAKAWFALAEAREQVALTRSTISTFSETEKLLRERFEAGIDEGGRSFASELLLAEADVANAREMLASQRELVGRTSRQLEVLAGRYPAGRAGETARLPDFPEPVPAGLPATLLDRRPDLAAAERRIAAADERLLEAKRSLLPGIGLTGSFGTASSDITDLLDGDLTVWSAAANLAQPILQGGRLRANVSRRESQRLEAAAEFEQAALTAFSEVENALAAESFFADRIEALTEAVDLARRAYRRSREEFENGTGDILTVLNAQRRVFTSRSQLLTLRRQRLENRVDLHLALGGSFRPVTPPPGDEDSPDDRRASAEERSPEDPASDP